MIKGQVVRTEKQYRQLDRLSSSDLRLFAKDRRKFFKTVVMKEDDTDEEEYSKSLLVGDLVHTMTLEPHLFDTKFLLSICTAPPTGLMLAFTEALYKHTMLNTTEDGVLIKDFKYLSEEAHKESGFKIGLDVVLKKFTGTNAEDYYNEMRQAKALGKTVVCLEDVSIAEKITENLESHPFTREIFYDRGDQDDTMNELKLEDFEIDGVPMKAMIDRFIPDDETKTIQPYDLKITWNPIQFYREYFLKRRADIQGYIYDQAVKKSLTKINPLYKDYKVEPIIFVVADSANFFAPLKYEMTEVMMKAIYEGYTIDGREYIGVREILEDLKWAQETATWTYTLEDERSNGFKLLK